MEKSDGQRNNQSLGVKEMDGLRASGWKHLKPQDFDGASDTRSWEKGLEKCVLYSNAPLVSLY